MNDAEYMIENYSVEETQGCWDDDYEVPLRDPIEIKKNPEGIDWGTEELPF